VWSEMREWLGRDPSQTADEKNERRVAKWCNRQRTNHKKGGLAKERVLALQNTPGWSWVGITNWEQQRKIWHDIAQQLGRNPRDTAEEENERRAATWCGTQRNDYKNGELAEERVLALQNTPGWSWVGIDWEERRQSWQDIAQRLGRDPRYTSKEENERRAAFWCSNQRSAYNNGELPEERVLALQNTPGWSWVGVDWEQRRQSWQDIAQRLGRDPSRTSEKEAERRAGRWCSSQRRAYNNGELREERVLALNKTPGWSWGTRR